VFARDGYTRASIEAIAVEAGVSTRTIYNHFAAKADLFQTVVEESAAPVAEAQIAIIDRHLRKIVDLEDDLVAFGRDLAAPMPDYGDHFSLVRQIDAEVGHIPPDAVEVWRQSGPVRVERELAAHLQQIADRGLLRITDAHQAARHLMLLVGGAVPFHHGVLATAEADIDEIVTAGVRAFLYGYQPEVARSAPAPWQP
jgi:AcrR family transcriptional regulator